MRSGKCAGIGPKCGQYCSVKARLIALPSGPVELARQRSFVAKALEESRKSNTDLIALPTMTCA